MNKKILIGCYEVPGFGGANTVGYRLFEQMQSDGYKVNYLNIINELDLEYFIYLYGDDFGNPKSLDNVHNVIVEGKLFKLHENLTEFVSDMSPDIIISIGYIAAYLLKVPYPQSSVIYLTTGCAQIKNYLEKDSKIDSIEIEKRLRNIDLPVIYNQNELKAVDKSDLIITHSQIIFDYYSIFFPLYTTKIHPEVFSFASYIYDDASDYKYMYKAFDRRKVDVLFVSSSWNRVEKNFQMAKRIAESLPNCNVQIIGETKGNIKNAIHHGIVTDREKLFEIMADTKTIVCPSKFDAAPGVLFEGSALGCNLVTSKNCGNWDLCNPQLLVENYDVKHFVDKINLSLESEYEDNIDRYLNNNAYSQLVETLSLI